MIKLILSYKKPICSFFMQKKFLFFLLSLSLILSVPVKSDEILSFEDDEIEYVGTCATSGLCNGVGYSMMGWGIAFVIGITILAVVINQSITAHYDSNADINSKATESTGGTDGYPYSADSTYGSII